MASGTAGAQVLDPIVAEEVIPAPLDSVWAAWTTDEGLRTWLAPLAEIDLRVGGVMRSHYDPQGTLGGPATIENTILAIEPGRLLSIQVTKHPDGFPFPEAIYEMWTVIHFEAAGEGETLVRMEGLGFGPEEESQQLRAFFAQGNHTTLRRLRTSFEVRAARGLR
jgi:uncharacterized protein YndB with AHSA1/START domain